MLPNLLAQLSSQNYCIGHLILTHNINTKLELDIDLYPFELTIIKNPFPLGFGANHNQAFKLSDKPYFCVLNPDVSLYKDPFKELLLCLEDSSIGVAAPVVFNKTGNIEDSFRHFPTPISLVKKLLFRFKDEYSASINSELIFPDWCAGMFLIFKKEVFKELNGFDESYFLYYEDIDICLRTWRSGKKVAVSKVSCIEHLAQRDSHKNLIYLKMHITSILRFFYKHLFRFPR
jgi:GT2 family glycosyltransferase